jgi:hemerythrin
MKWTQKYATGILRLDEQHQLLFKMSEDYGETLAAGKGQRVYALMLKGLTEYARAHFDFEEQCMYRHHCPAALDNSAAHRRFLRGLDGFKERHAVSGFNEHEAKRLVSFVDDWLASHIGLIDIQLKPCVTNSAVEDEPT